MSTKPRVSVIVPTYADRAPRLQSALASVWAQEGLGEQFDVEVVVVDDASWGPTEEVVRRFPGTRYIRFESNRGQAAARNAGLAEATGKYVAFLDDDDLWLPHRLSLQVAALEQGGGSEVAYSQMFGVFPDGTSGLSPTGRPPSGWIFARIFQGIASVGTMLVPMQVFDAIGTFDESLPAGEDGDWSMRLALRFPFRYVRGPVTVYLASKRDWTTFSERKIQSWLLRRDKILALVRGTPNEAEVTHLVLTGTWVHVLSMLLKAGRFDEARRTLLRALEEFPTLESDGWYGSGMKGLVLELALASDSNKAAKSLFACVKRTGSRRRGLWRRLQMRAFIADLWTGVALHNASGRRRNDRAAGAAAGRAILQNPLQALRRPGLLRLALRPIALVGRRQGAQVHRSRHPQAAPSRSHADDASSASVADLGNR